jgi:hypothetical protein
MAARIVIESRINGTHARPAGIGYWTEAELGIRAQTMTR